MFYEDTSPRCFVTAVRMPMQGHQGIHLQGLRKNRKLSADKILIVSYTASLEANLSIHSKPQLCTFCRTAQQAAG